MTPGLVTLLRSKGLALAVHLGFWVLLVLVLAELGGHAPEYREATTYSLPAHNPVPVSRLASMFSPHDWPAEVLNTNLLSPFYTTAFVPSPKPPPPPPPPPPTTRRVALVYQGYYQAGEGPRIATFKGPQGFAKAAIGEQVVTNFFVSDITLHGLTLTNTTGQTNLLLLNTPAELDIPIR